MGTKDWRESLTERDGVIIHACLRAAVKGPFFDEWEFHALFGLERDEVNAVLATWPETDNPQGQVGAVLRSMDQLLGFPHGRDDVWSDFIPASREEVDSLKWRILGEIPLDGAKREALAWILENMAAHADDALARRPSSVRRWVALARRHGLPIPDRLA